MTLRPQKAPSNKAKAASEESEQTSRATQQIQSEVEERPKKNAGAKKSAQKQHDAQPEVANTPQGLNETQWPVRKLGRGVFRYLPGGGGCREHPDPLFAEWSHVYIACHTYAFISSVWVS